MTKTSKTILWIVIVIIIIGGIWYGVSRKSKEEGVIKVGFTSALSGNYANIGKDILKGVEEAFSETDATKIFGKDIELIIEDNEADPSKAVTAYQLLKAKNAKIVMSSFSGVTAALNPLSREDKIILMYNAMTPTYAEENEYAFKVYAGASEEASAIVKAIKEKSGKIGLVYVNNPTTVIMYEKISNELDNLVSYGFDMKETDFRTIILKLRNAKIENLIITAYPNQILNFIRQSVELDYSPKYIFVNSDGVDREVINNVEEYLSKNTIYVTIGYGEEPQDIYYIFGYDLAKILIEGMKRCQDIGRQPDNSECLKGELLKIKIKGKSGFISMERSGIAVVLPGYYTVVNKKLVPFEE